MITIVSAPADLIIATSDGIDVRLAGIEFDVGHPPHAASPTARGVQINLEGVRGLQARRRDVQFESARKVWADQVKMQGKEGAGPAPTMPAVPILERVGVLVADDLGTEYRLAAGQVAGEGTEWYASWVYLPLPPAEA